MILSPACYLLLCYSNFCIIMPNVATSLFVSSEQTCCLARQITECGFRSPETCDEEETYVAYFKVIESNYDKAEKN